MQAYVRWVTANWFFPSNGLKRYFNGPLRRSLLGENQNMKVPKIIADVVKFPWKYTTEIHGSQSQQKFVPSCSVEQERTQSDNIKNIRTIAFKN